MVSDSGRRMGEKHGRQTWWQRLLVEEQQWEKEHISIRKMTLLTGEARWVKVTTELDTIEADGLIGDHCVK